MQMRKEVDQVEIRNAVYLIITIFVNVIASYAAFVAAPPEATMGDLYRIFYIHTPAAWVCYLSLGIALLSSILFLVKRDFIYDTLAEVSAILGLIYGAIALVTGSIWSKVAWGAYWNWDPRQTT
ncbi:MAG: cytochrome c biogenesis protein CcsA, partial [Candidatus Heimdallarchaeota archaeon]